MKKDYRVYYYTGSGSLGKDSRFKKSYDSIKLLKERIDFLKKKGLNKSQYVIVKYYGSYKSKIIEIYE